MTKKYENYKPSNVEWIEVIPNHWKSKNIKNLTKNIKTGKTPSTKVDDYFKDGTVNWFRPNDISSSFLLKESSKKISDLALRENQVNMLSENAVLMNTIGAVGNISFVSKKHSTNQQITHIKFRDSNKYYAYLLKNLKSFVFCLANTTTLPQLNNDRLKYLYLIRPPLKEQEAIANYLDKKTQEIDDSVETLKKQKDLLMEERKAIIHKAVTKGLDDTVPMKDSGVEWIGEIPENKILNKLKRSLISHPKSKLQVSEHDESFNIPFFTSSQKLSKFIEKGLVKDESIIMGTGGIANIHYFNGEYAYSTDCWSFKSKNIKTKYLYYYLNSMKDVINDIGFEGMGLKHLQKSFIYNLLIPNYTKKEQQEIVEYLDKKTSRIDEALKEIENQINLLEEYKKVLINDVVTGKKRVYNGEI